MSVDAAGVAVLTIDNAPVNAFGPITCQSLQAAYSAADADDRVKAIVITGTGANFMAGADILHIHSSQLSGDFSGLKSMLAPGTLLYNAIEQGEKPTVAAINGVCLGGGLELAMACNARVGVPKSVYGLPELRLGLIPGLGGTQRLPRLIGLKAAVTATLKSKTLKSKKALKSGLIDSLEKNPKNLLATASKLALALAAGSVPRRQSLFLTDKIGNVDQGKLLIQTQRLKLARRAMAVPMHLAYLDAVEMGLEKGGSVGLALEGELIAKCAASAVSKNLIHVFFAQRESSKIPDSVRNHGHKIKTVAVLGGGTMGAGIALVYLMKGYTVILKELNQQYADRAAVRIADIIADFLKKRRMPALAIEQMMRGLTCTDSYDDFKKVDLVIEAVLEDVALKQKIFADLERVCHDKTILASNTSTIDIDLIGKHLSCRDRLVGLHFFSPAHVMPLLEIIRTSSTSAAVVSGCLSMSKRLGKIPVVVGNCVGFVANRVFFPYGMGACLLADRGVDPFAIDAALMKVVGMPMGVFRMSDLSGLDIAVHVGGIISQAYPDRVYLSQLIPSMKAAKRLGEKTGAGFYDYTKNKRGVPAPKAIAEHLATASRAAGSPKKLTLSAKDIVEMVLFPVVNECHRTVGEGFALRESDVDVASIMGYGFPAHTGGVMFWGENYPGGGLKYVAARLQEFADTVGANDAKVRAFYEPSARLLERARGQ